MQKHCEFALFLQTNFIRESIVKCFFRDNEIHFILFQIIFDLGMNENLGLMIRGGIEYGLGIFITGVEPQSAALRNDLRVRKSFFLILTF